MCAQSVFQRLYNRQKYTLLWDSASVVGNSGRLKCCRLKLVTGLLTVNIWDAELWKTHMHMIAYTQRLPLAFTSVIIIQCMCCNTLYTHTTLSSTWRLLIPLTVCGAQPQFTHPIFFFFGLWCSACILITFQRVIETLTLAPLGSTGQKNQVILVFLCGWIVLWHVSPTSFCEYR